MKQTKKPIIRMIGRYSGRVCIVTVQYADKTIERIRLDFDKSGRRIRSVTETAEHIEHFPTLYKGWRAAS